MVASGTPSDSSIFNCTDPLRIGMDNGATRSWNGHMDELRITKGVARYGSDAGFTVPSFIQEPDRSPALLGRA